jgi:plasmid maintenance system antidote protein VapI
MGKFSDNIVNQRFKIVYDKLLAERRIKGKSDLANYLESYNHVINSILQGNRNVTVDQINALCDHFGVNANYIFGVSDAIYLDGAGSDVPTRSINDLDYAGRNNITLVPQKAVAGYTVSLGTGSFMNELQQFSIPGVDGRLTAFEIEGDSMLPNLTSGDMVVCEPVEPNARLKENAIYIIVTDTVVAKRIQQIKDGNEVSQLLLISDNDTTYKPYKVDIEEVRQILQVKMRLTKYGIM